MAFLKKSWARRMVEFPGRRRLTDVATGEQKVYDVARNEGTVSKEGDAFSVENMDDLEQRIADGFSEINGKLENFSPARLREALKYSGLITEESTYDEILAALAAYWPAFDGWLYKDGKWSDYLDGFVVSSYANTVVPVPTYAPQSDSLLLTTAAYNTGGTSGNGGSTITIKSTREIDFSRYNTLTMKYGSYQSIGSSIANGSRGKLKVNNLENSFSVNNTTSNSANSVSLDVSSINSGHIYIEAPPAMAYGTWKTTFYLYLSIYSLELT